jgi:hypothetical protein
MRGEVLLKPVKRHDAIMIDAIDSPYSSIESLRKTIYARGIEPSEPETKADAKGASK